MTAAFKLLQNFDIAWWVSIALPPQHTEHAAPLMGAARRFNFLFFNITHKSARLLPLVKHSQFI